MNISVPIKNRASMAPIAGTESTISLAPKVYMQPEDMVRGEFAQAMGGSQRSSGGSYRLPDPPPPPPPPPISISQTDDPFEGLDIVEAPPITPRTPRSMLYPPSRPQGYDVESPTIPEILDLPIGLSREGDSRPPSMSVYSEGVFLAPDEDTSYTSAVSDRGSMAGTSQGGKGLGTGTGTGTRTRQEGDIYF